MGLDMYLSKVKKIDDMTLNEILTTEEYIDYLGRSDKYSDSSFESWCGGDIDEVRKDMIDKVKANIKTRYPAWDDEKKYGHDTVAEELAYWRKANQIHNWFVENVQDCEDDCGRYIVDEDQLTELYETAKTVLDSIKLVPAKVKNGTMFKDGEWVDNIIDGNTIEDPSVAEELLPSQSGFFFGSTDYDEWYYEDIKSTVKQLEKVLKETDFDNEYVYYRSSW